MTLEEASRALQIVTKWRTLFTGWQLGTRPKGDPEANAVRDHRELTILLRVECTALAALLIKKGIITGEELTIAMGEEAVLLNKDYENRFPGVTASEIGLAFDARSVDWMKHWKP